MSWSAAATSECGGQLRVVEPVVQLSACGPPDRPVLRPMLMRSDQFGAQVSLVPEGALLLTLATSAFAHGWSSRSRSSR